MDNTKNKGHKELSNKNISIGLLIKKELFYLSDNQTKPAGRHVKLILVLSNESNCL
jgi:hypothetical protein